MRRRLIIDLDSTLIHTSSDIRSFEKLGIYTQPQNADLRPRVFALTLNDITQAPGTGTVSPMWGIVRPGFERFRDYITREFEAFAVWSAGHPKYVRTIVDILFREHPPNHILTSKDCVFEGTSSVLKPLEKLASQGYTQENTFCLDDRTDTFSRNPENGILAPDFEPRATLADLRRPDPFLEKLVDFWEQHRETQVDARSLVKAWRLL